MKYTYVLENKDYYSDLIYKDEIIKYNNKIFMEYNDINLEIKKKEN
jgi:hypothetical protein